MKNTKLISILLMAVVAISGCKKDETEIVADATTEEAAAIVATSFCTGSAGTMTQMEDAVGFSQPEGYKSTLADSTFTITNQAGAIITYQYAVTYSFGFLTPNTYQLAYNSSGNYASPSSLGVITSEGALTISGIIDNSSSFSCNGNAGRNGTFTMKNGNSNSITATVATTISDFKFNKNTGICESGTASVVCSGSTSLGKTFSYSGTLEYLGNYTGSLTLNGQNFTVNLKTGTIG
jgi:hypothetical protein